MNRENNIVYIPIYPKELKGTHLETEALIRYIKCTDTHFCFSSSNHSTLSGDKPCDYAMSGPQPPIDVKVAVCEEIPTYAVVDKAKKKDKKKNKKAAEQKAIDDQYAVVDKSKKNKKNEPDNTYAEVDISNKSKKVCQPLFLLRCCLAR